MHLLHSVLVMMVEMQHILGNCWSKASRLQLYEGDQEDLKRFQEGKENLIEGLWQEFNGRATGHSCSQVTPLQVPGDEVLPKSPPTPHTVAAVSAFITIFSQVVLHHLPWRKTVLFWQYAFSTSL